MADTKPQPLLAEKHIRTLEGLLAICELAEKRNMLATNQTMFDQHWLHALMQRIHTAGGNIEPYQHMTFTAVADAVRAAITATPLLAYARNPGDRYNPANYASDVFFPLADHVWQTVPDAKANGSLRSFSQGGLFYTGIPEKLTGKPGQVFDAIRMQQGADTTQFVVDDAHLIPHLGELLGKFRLMVKGRVDPGVYCSLQ